MADQGVTEAHVAEAEEAKRVAKANALELEQRLVTGDDTVTSEQLAAQQSAARYAVLRVQGVKAKLAAAQEAKRQQDLAELKAEIDQYVADAGTRMSADLQAALDARDRFLATTAEHDETVDRWTRRAGQLNAPQVASSLLTKGLPSEVALGRPWQESLVVGKRQLRHIDGPSYFKTVINSTAPEGHFVDQLKRIDGDEADA
jgi:hypothetical protein